MNAVDASDHFQASGSAGDSSASMLAIVLDTNPRSWAALHDKLPLSRAAANLLVFLNAHMALGTANRVAVVAAHTNRSAWLYPNPSYSATTSEDDGDVAMMDATASMRSANGTTAHKEASLVDIENTVLSNLSNLIHGTTEADLECSTTLLSGALTLALNLINRTFLNVNVGKSGPAEEESSKAAAKPRITARILVISVSDSEPSQYISTMNTVFAAAHSSIAIDTLSLCGDATLLQQAAFITNGTFLRAAEPGGLLQYLMVGFTTDNEIAARLMTASHTTVDFRAACFCHGKVVDMGFVCSICLSIFCELPPNSTCITCGTSLDSGSLAVKPIVIPRKKKKKKKAIGTGNATPETTTSTPGP